MPFRDNFLKPMALDVIKGGNGRYSCGKVKAAKLKKDGAICSSIKPSLDA